MTVLPADSLFPARVLIVGQGRMGGALTAALRETGVDVRVVPGRGSGPIRHTRADPEPENARGDSPARGATAAEGDDAGAVDVVLLAVPDAAIAQTASRIGPGPLVGHVSGATGLDALAPHEAFGLHPLLTVAGPGARFEGAAAAVAGSTRRALATARDLAAALGMRAFEVCDEDRAAYHAAASVASNFLVVVEGLAEDLAGTAGVSREALAPLVRAAVENWVRHGAAAALTGPVARGDEGTVERQRCAVAERLPDSLPLFDALVAATRELAAKREAAAPREPTAEKTRAAGAGAGTADGAEQEDRAHPKNTSRRAGRAERDGGEG